MKTTIKIAGIKFSVTQAAHTAPTRTVLARNGKKLETPEVLETEFNPARNGEMAIGDIEVTTEYEAGEIASFIREVVPMVKELAQAAVEIRKAAFARDEACVNK